MDFAYSPKAEELREKLTAFMQDRILPAEAIAAGQLAGKPDFWGARRSWPISRPRRRDRGCGISSCPPPAVPA